MGKYIEQMSLNLQPVLLFAGHLLSDTVLQKTERDGLQFDPAQPLLFPLSQNNLCSLSSTAFSGFGITSIKRRCPQYTSVIIQNALNKKNNTTSVFWF